VKPIRVRAANEQSSAVGVLVDEALLITRTDTVLDPHICENGGLIELPINIIDIYGREINKLYYPAFACDQIGQFIILNPIAVAGNRVLKIVEEFNKGTVEARTLISAVRSYQLAAVNILSGKGGLVSSNVLSSRTSNSGRAVLVPSTGDRHPDYIGLPSRIMARLAIEPEEPVIVGRDPTIWHGSLEVMRAYQVDHDCIEAHPLVFPQWAADSDGDQVYVYKIPETGECLIEASEQVGAFTKANGKWPGWLSRGNKPGESVNWDRVVEETRERAAITGFSVSPREILEGGQRFIDVCRAVDKEAAIEECPKIARGIDKEEVKDYLLKQNATQLETKIWLGPIGAASNRLKVVAGTDRELLKSAMYVSERLQQMLLSSKHVVGAKKKEAYSIQGALSLLNRRGKYQNADLRTALSEIEKMGLDLRQAKPIITHLWIGYAIHRTALLYLERSPMSKSKTRVGQLEKIVRDINFGEVGEIRKHVNKILEVLRLCKISVSLEEFRAKFLQENAGLSRICTRDFPVFDICSAAGPESARVELAKRVVLQGEKDPTGLGKLALEMAQVQGEQ
jgi:hypothetical protein